MCDTEMSKVGCRCERLKRGWDDGGCFDQSEGCVNGHTETYNCIKEIGLATGKGVPIMPTHSWRTRGGCFFHEWCSRGTRWEEGVQKERECIPESSGHV